MLITIKDLQKYQPKILSRYMCLHVKAIEAYKLIDGNLYKQYHTDSIRSAMAEKKNVALTAFNLGTKSREKSLGMIALVLDAVNKIEGKDESNNN